MKTVILGAGAMGSLYGALLAESGQDVWLFDTWQEHVDTINRSGLEVTGLSGNRKVRTRATSDPSEPGIADLVIVLVKAYNTSAAMKQILPMVGDHTILLTLQNGLGNVEEIGKHVPQDRVLVGVTSLGATMLAPGKVRHDGTGDTYVGEADGSITERLTGVVAVFNKAGIKTYASDNLTGLIWSKLLQNAGINAVTSATQLRNGRLLDFPSATELMLKAVGEGAEIAGKLGIRLVYDDALENVKRACRLSDDKVSSMLQDILRERKTEVDFINGKIVAEGARVGVPTPVNQVLCTVIKALEESFSARVR